jgi:pyruvate-formate lyase
MHNGQLSILNDNENINYSSNIRSSQYVTLQIEYTDKQEDLVLTKKTQFLSTNTIRQVIKEFLKLVCHEHIRLENVKLIAVHSDRRIAVPAENLHMTLQQLKIADGYTLYIEPSLTSVTSTPSYLSIYGSINLEKIQYK